MTRAKVLLVLLGLLCLAVGLVVGLRPLSATVSPLLGQVPAQVLTCGSALAPRDHPSTFAFTSDQPGYGSRLSVTIDSCSAVRHDSFVATIILFVSGGLLLTAAPGLGLRRRGPGRPVAST